MGTQASGCIIVSKKTKRILLQLRAPNKNNKCLWSFWGGTHEQGENPVQAVIREIGEELGTVLDIEKLYPLYVMTSNDTNFEYNTFVAVIEDEFTPILNDESYGYAWVDIQYTPKPLHPGAYTVFNNPRISTKLRTIINSIDSL